MILDKRQAEQVQELVEALAFPDGVAVSVTYAFPRGARASVDFGAGDRAKASVLVVGVGADGGSTSELYLKMPKFLAAYEVKTRYERDVIRFQNQASKSYADAREFSGPDDAKRKLQRDARHSFGLFWFKHEPGAVLVF